MNDSREPSERPGERTVLQRYLSDARRLAPKGTSRSDLVESHLFYVLQVAKEYSRLGVPIEDLLSEGNLGLLEAADRFDPKRGVKFVSYATWWIRKRILDMLTRQMSLVRIPKHRVARIRRLRQVEAHLYGLLGRRPTPQEIATDSGLSVEEVESFDLTAQREVSLDEILDRDRGLKLEDILAESRGTHADGEVIREDCEEQIGIWIEKLPSRHRLVLQMHFGLDGTPPRTLAEIGRSIGVSRERVRQLERQALIRLRRLMEPQLRSRTA